MLLGSLASCGVNSEDNKTPSGENTQNNDDPKIPGGEDDPIDPKDPEDPENPGDDPKDPENPGEDPKEPEEDPDDLWKEPEEGEVTKDTNLPEKSGETYEKYCFKPTIGTKIPEITIALTETEGSIPRMSNTKIVTGSRQDKGDYYNCNVTVDNYDGEDLGIVDKACQVKVRGNYTANYRKKPLRLKFEKKLQMPGFEGKFKNWVLLADVKDHSMMRNALSFYMGKTILGSDGLYSSNFRPVEVYFIDGSNQKQYWGSYLLVEQQEVKDGRIGVTDVGDLVGEDEVKGNYDGVDIGYFFEYDGYYTEEMGSNYNWNTNYFKVGYDTGTYGDPTFTIPYNNRASYRTVSGNWQSPSQPGFTLKSDLSGHDNTKQLNFISNYTENVYKIIYEATYNNKFYKFNEDYTAISLDTSLNSEKAISQVIDVNSLVDMYIINEASCDPDVAWSSFYLDVDFGKDAKDHLLRFEAPWDFDSCYSVREGNFCNDAQGYYAGNSSNPWLSVILNNTWFFNKVKDKFNELYKYDILKDYLDFLDNTSNLQIYKDMYKRNFDRWGTNDETGEVKGEIARLQTEREHALWLKDWLYKRFNWMSKTWGEGFDIATHEKEYVYSSEGNVALLTNGKKFRYEAENAKFDDPIAKRERQNYGASNDAYLGNISGNSGKNIEFEVIATKAKQAYIVASVSRFDHDVNFNDYFKIYVNNEPLKIRDVFVPGIPNYSWHDWSEIKLNSTWLQEGKNTIKFVVGANAGNFDYIDIYSKDELK